MKKISVVLTIFLAACGSSEEPKEAVYAVEGVAIAGYDPVAYFEQGEAKMGEESSTSFYEGLTYQFSSTKNKNLFDSDPKKYIPEYGGWCAYAVAEASTKMQPDPTMWQIQDGRLLLFYDDWTTSLTGSLKDEWNTDQENYLTKADKNWQVVGKR